MIYKTGHYITTPGICEATLSQTPRKENLPGRREGKSCGNDTNLKGNILIRGKEYTLKLTSSITEVEWDYVKAYDENSNSTSMLVDFSVVPFPLRFKSVAIFLYFDL